MSEPHRPEEIGLFAYQVFSKLEGAVTAGDGPPGRPARPLPRRWPTRTRPLSTERPGRRGSASTSAGCGSGPTTRAPPTSSRSTTTSGSRLAPEAVAVLATPDHPAFGMGSFHHLPADDGDRSSGCRRPSEPAWGSTYDDHGPECAEGIARGFEPWMRANLRPHGPARARRCGGQARSRRPGPRRRMRRRRAWCCELARRFPASQVHRLRHLRSTPWRGPGSGRRRQASTTSPSSILARPPMPSDGSADLVTTFDCIHDMTDPAGVIAAIRAALADDGTWLLVDIKAHDTFAENARRNPMASLMYGISVLTCMSSSAVRAGWRRARDAGTVGRAGRGDGHASRLHPLSAARDRPPDQRLLRDPALRSPSPSGGRWAICCHTSGSTG